MDNKHCKNRTPTENIWLSQEDSLVCRGEMSFSINEKGEKINPYLNLLRTKYVLGHSES